MLKKLCAHCGNSFLPRPQTPDQSYCSDPQCQKARRKRWVDEKRKSDFIFRDNQAILFEKFVVNQHVIKTV